MVESDVTNVNTQIAVREEDQRYVPDIDENELGLKYLKIIQSNDNDLLDAGYNLGDVVDSITGVVVPSIVPLMYQKEYVMLDETGSVVKWRTVNPIRLSNAHLGRTEKNPPGSLL